MTSGSDHNSNRLKLNASVDEEWHLLVRVVKKDAGNGQPQLHPGSGASKTQAGCLALRWVLQGWRRHQQVSPGWAVAGSACQPLQQPSQRQGLFPSS